MERPPVGPGASTPPSAGGLRIPQNGGCDSGAHTAGHALLAGEKTRSVLGTAKCRCPHPVPAARTSAYPRAHQGDRIGRYATGTLKGQRPATGLASQGGVARREAVRKIAGR